MEQKRITVLYAAVVECSHSVARFSLHCWEDAPHSPRLVHFRHGRGGTRGITRQDQYMAGEHSHRVEYIQIRRSLDVKTAWTNTGFLYELVHSQQHQGMSGGNPRMLIYLISTYPFSARGYLYYCCILSRMTSCTDPRALGCRHQGPRAEPRNCFPRGRQPILLLSMLAHQLHLGQNSEHVGAVVTR